MPTLQNDSKNACFKERRLKKDDFKKTLTLKTPTSKMTQNGGFKK
jgi:hypothetical protein